MGFFDKIGKFILGTDEKSNAEAQRAYQWASNLSDRQLMDEFRRTTQFWKKAAINKVMKERGLNNNN